MQDLEKKYKAEGVQFIKCEFDNPKDFYNALKDMEKYTNENIKISGTSREGHYEMVINEDEDMDDTTKTPEKEKEKPDEKKKKKKE